MRKTKRSYCYLWPPWTPEEDAEIERIIRRGVRNGDWRRLAKKWFRTHSAVRMRVYNLRRRSKPPEILAAPPQGER